MEAGRLLVRGLAALEVEDSQLAEIRASMVQLAAQVPQILDRRLA
ncbi:MAG: hypothetical protein WCT12_00775 [Verrucomicrobiota bacterium]